MANKPKNLTDERFEHAVSFVLSHEGGYSNDINDDGGELNLEFPNAATLILTWIL